MLRCLVIIPHIFDLELYWPLSWLLSFSMLLGWAVCVNSCSLDSKRLGYFFDSETSIDSIDQLQYSNAFSMAKRKTWPLQKYVNHKSYSFSRLVLVMSIFLDFRQKMHCIYCRSTTSIQTSVFKKPSPHHFSNYESKIVNFLLNIFSSPFKKLKGKK
jgi:hypothetical protein